MSSFAVDDSIVGREVGRATFPLDRSKLRELALALQDEDPVWHDPEAARAAGFDGVPMPPTWTVLADHWLPGGLVGPALAVGMDLERLLHGEAAWEHMAPVRLGDELTAVTVVDAVDRREGRRGGTMTFVAFTTTFTNARGTVVCRLRDTFIETAAP